jgi:hypothetical protein
MGGSDWNDGSRGPNRAPGQRHGPGCVLGSGRVGDAKHVGRVVLGTRVTNLMNQVEARVTRLAWIATRVRDWA